MIGRLLAAMRTPAVRIGFVVLALGFGVFALASRWSQVREALGAVSVLSLVAALVVSMLFVLATLGSWRAVLRDLGSDVPWRTAMPIFLVSQLGKYLPGGVWNFLAAAEMGTDADIPRRRSISGMLVALLISVTTGLALAVAAILVGPAELRQDFGWLALLLPLLLALLVPPVLNRVLGLLLRLARRPALEVPLSAPGVARAAAWAVLAWVLGGLQVWIFATGVGLPGSAATLALSVAGYALAWTAGFLVVVVPAGIGVREAALALALSGYLEPGPVLVVVLLSRVVLTVADVALGLGAVLASRRSGPRDRGVAPGPGPAGG